MQNVRIILKENQTNEGKVYENINVSINFDEKLVKIWNGAYWEETPFEKIKILATWNEE